MTQNRLQAFAFAMIHQDRIPVAHVAETLGIPAEQVLAMAAAEAKAQAKAGTFPLNSASRDRGHAVTASADKVCDTHGPYVSEYWKLNNPPERLPENMRGFWSNCPTCNSFMQADVDKRTAEIRNRKANQDALRKEALRGSGIPERFLEVDVWHWQRGMDKQREAWEVVKSYCMRIEDVIQHGRCLVLFGESGTGKTHLACGIIRHVVEKGGTGHYTTIQDAIGKIRSTYSKKADASEDEVLNQFCTVDVLVLDELGRQSDSAHERETMFRILNRRYADLRPTVLVTNLDRVKLHQFIGQALADRLLEAGGRFINFDWASQRSRKTPETNKDKETDQ